MVEAALEIATQFLSELVRFLSASALWCGPRRVPASRITRSCTDNAIGSVFNVTPQATSFECALLRP